MTDSERDEAADVDPEAPRPEGHYPAYRDNQWHYVPDELARTITVGPAGNGEDGQDWVLSYTLFPVCKTFRYPRPAPYAE